MRYDIAIAIVFFFTGLTNLCYSQRVIFRNYTVNDGLVANTVRRIFQDSKGFLWIGTYEGLSKYDGYRFTNYSTANGLSHNMINDLYESTNGTLYVASNDGYIDAITENRVTQKAAISGLIVNRIYASSPDHAVAVTDRNGIHEFSNGKMAKPEQPFPFYSYNDLAWLNDSLFITITDSTLQVFDRKYELFGELSYPLPALRNHKIYIDSKKRIWSGASGGLKMLSFPLQKNKHLEFVSPPPPFNNSLLQQSYITYVFEDADHTIWIGTTRGLIRVDTDGSYQLLTTQHGLISDNITCIFQDHEKNIWFGTTSGLSKMVTRSGIKVFNTENGLLSNSMNFAFPLKKEYLLVGDDKAVQLFNNVTKRFTAIVNTSKDLYYSSIRGSRPVSLFGANKIILFDTATLQYREKESYHFSDHYFYCSVGDNKNNFFLGDHYNLYFLSGDSTQPRIILNKRTTDLVVDKNGNLWAATWDDGIYRIRYEVNNGKIKVLATDQFLPVEKIRCLFEDSKGNIWAGSRYNGVYIFRSGKNNVSISRLDQRNGLTSNWIKAITEDNNGSIWLAFYQGLDKLTAQDSSFSVFNFSRVNNYFTGISTMTPGEGNSLWLATAEGLAQITDGAMEASPPLPVYITGISTPDSQYASSAGELELSHRHNQLQFEFSSPGFINETQILYSYRLSGSSNPEWTKAANQHSVSYANLQPGNYRFEVRMKGWNGEWGTTTAFEFVILPPFWKTWWFIVLFSLTACLLLYLLIKRRIGHVRKEAELKQKIAETEMSALRAQMNPHFIFNCISAIDNMIQTNQKDKATRYLTQFAKLIRAVLDSSKNNLVLFHKDFESLQLFLQLEQFRSNNKFDYELYADPEILNSDIKVPPLIAQPFVENAIHHGLMNKTSTDRKLTVMVKLEKDFLKYTIEDNGIGRQKAQSLKELNKPEHFSYGISISKKRIDLHNHRGSQESVVITDLQMDNEPVGTRVELWLSLK
jgi:ligand-binding sensor domain-containing protein